MIDPAPPGITVLVCCYNSAARLPQTIRHLALQQVPADFNWEIIVVDNASADDTFGVAELEWQQYNLSTAGFKVLSEPRSGKNHALNTGVDNARYEYIIICDDDNWLNEFYVHQAFQTMQSNVQIGAAGGQGVAVTDEEIPDWFWQHQHSYAVGKQNNTTGDVSARGYLWGAGMIFRKSLYKRVNDNLPSILLGPSQNEAGRAEDVELCMRFLLAGYRLYYDDKLIFRHHIHGNRLTDTYKHGFLNMSRYEERVLNIYRKQIQINSLTTIGRLGLLCTSMFRYLICKIFPRNRRWHYTYEAEMIYLLTGVQPSPVSDEAIRIRSLNLNLSAKTVA